VVAELVVIPKLPLDRLNDAKQNPQCLPADPTSAACVGKNGELVHDKPAFHFSSRIEPSTVKLTPIAKPAQNG